MKPFKYTIIITFLIVFSNQSNAQNSLKDRFIDLSVTGGAWLGAPGDIWVGRTDSYTDKSTSFLLKLCSDVYMNKHFAIGVYINFCPGYDHKSLSSDNNSKMFEYGAGFKPVFYFSDKTCMKIGANVGLRRYWSDYVSTTGRGLGVNCSIEIQHLLKNSGSITFEPGFLAQPTGFANSDKNKYNYPPIFYINIGYTFSAFSSK